MREFEWERSASGYDITDENGVPIVDIRLKRHEELNKQPSSWWFTPSGEEQVCTKPFKKKGPRRCRRLVGAFEDPDWAEAALDFVNEYGLLTETKPGQAEPFAVLYTHYERVRIMLQLYDEAIQLDDGRKRRSLIGQICKFYNDAPWGASTAKMQAEEEHFPILTMQPKNLEHALWLEFAEMMQLGDDWRKCIECGQWFKPERVRIHKPNKFCSPKCGQDYRNKKRSRRRKSI